MAPLVLTLVRHGESVDNLTSLWAGARDAPLTQHGAAQAARLGKAFAAVPITTIYTSNLKRAHSTARAIYDANSFDPKPPFVVSPLLQEQNFGDAEGQAWNEGKFNSAGLPWEDHRAFQLAPHAESLNDVAERADLALRYFIAPHLLASAQAAEGENGHHVVLVAHGIFLAEMMFALKRGENKDARFLKKGGYTNTGWARVEIEVLESTQPERIADTTTVTSQSSLSKSPYAHLPKTALDPHTDVLPPPLLPNDSIPAIRVKIVAVNQTAHLDGLVRQKGGIGSLAHDEKQKKMQDFFSGASGGGLEKWEGK